MYSEDLLSLFKRRFGGAVNIRGIDFQILFALSKSLELLKPNAEIERLTLEGLEDVDLKTFQSGNTYIQVKTSSHIWHLHEFIIPFKNFIGITDYENTGQNSFLLALNFELRPNIQNLFRLDTLDLREQEKLKKGFLKLISKENIPDALALDVLKRTTVISISRETLIRNIKTQIVEAFEVNPESADIYLQSLAYQFIEWSFQRKSISKQDLQKCYIDIQGRIERKVEFEAFGKHLISKIAWEIDKKPSDFFEGKITRPGHISLELDVKRPKWIEAIDRVFAQTNTCIIRAASGQGKSTLALRYIYESWNHAYTYVVKVAETRQQAQQILNYFGELVKLGLPVSVFIDDVKAEIKYYSEILAGCSSAGVTTLVTIRNEDHAKFSNSGFTGYDFVIPFFDLVEAKQIYANLKKERRIHQSVRSAEWAFELIDSPKSLIEYIYLLTQGQMLKDRLVEQVAAMRQQNQYEKIDFLRKVILMDTCRLEININQLLLNQVSINIDYQLIIKELNNEFITIDKGIIKGHHWVRSNHLLRILHEDYTNPAITALSTLAWLKQEQIETYLGNLAGIENMDYKLFMHGLIKVESVQNLKLLIFVLRGLFLAGETLFYIQNKKIFDESFEKYNEGGIFLLLTSCLPTTKIDTIDEMMQIFGENANFSDIKRLSQLLNHQIRGFTLIKNYLEHCNIFTDVNSLEESLKNLGETLDWLYWSQSDLRSLRLCLESCIDRLPVFDLEIWPFALFSLGLYRYKPDLHQRWFITHKASVIKKLESALQCSISLSKDEVTVKYTKYDPHNESFNEATMRRLDVVRSAIPFCQKYNGGNSILPFVTTALKIRYKYAYDDSRKNVPAQNLQPQADIEKNKVIKCILEDRYRPKTWYEFQETYFLLRKDLLEYTQELCKRLSGLKDKIGIKNAPYLSEQILQSPKKMPYDIQDESVNNGFKGCNDYFNSFSNFLNMKSRYITNLYDEQAKMLIFLNYNNFLHYLSDMQGFFKSLQSVAPYYFPFEDLEKSEKLVFTTLKKLLQLNIQKSENYWDLNSVLEN